MTVVRTFSLASLALSLGFAVSANADDVKVDVTTGEHDHDGDGVADHVDGACPADCENCPAKKQQMSTAAEAPAVEGVTPEERARAAEQFEAAMEKMRSDHAAELEKVRQEERDLAAQKYEADINTARDEERARMEAQSREVAVVVEDDDDDEVIPGVQRALITPLGVYGFLGGGATDFIESNALGATGTGGFWDARLGIGSRSIIGGEVAYVGGLHDINALGISEDAFLMNNGVEGVARLNAPITTEDAPVLVEPYAFGGLGYQHYTVANDDVNTSDVRGNDDIMVVPMGLGLALGFGGVTLDARATYRHTYFTDMFGDTTNSFDDTSMSNWGAGAALGFEF